MKQPLVHVKAAVAVFLRKFRTTAGIFPTETPGMSSRRCDEGLMDRPTSSASGPKGAPRGVVDRAVERAAPGSILAARNVVRRVDRSQIRRGRPDRVQKLVLLSRGGLRSMVKQFTRRGMVMEFLPT